MATYFDSSALIAILLEESGAEACQSTWASASLRCSSVLVRAECAVTLRRLGAHAAPRDRPEWASKQLAAAGTYLAQLELQDLNATIADIIDREPRLAGCRALDAIHLATALYFRPHLDEPLYICTLDRRLRAVAVKLGFEVRPE